MTNPVQSGAQPPTQGGGAGDLDWLSVGAWMGFAASVIKSGEPWTDQCQREYDEAKAAFARLSALQAAPSEGGEPVGYVSQYAIDSMADARAEGLYEEFQVTASPWESKTVPVYVRPPAPSEEPLVGCVVVPREPTLRMVEAGFETGRVLARDDVKVVWHAMRAAAPAPDAIRGGE